VIDNQHEFRPTPPDVKAVRKIARAPQAPGRPFPCARTILMSNFPPVPHVPCTMMFVEVAFLITKTRLHNNSGY